MKKIFITSDIDWAVDEIIVDFLSILEAYNASCTFFFTHETDVIKKMDSDFHEIAIHPNFNPSLINGEPLKAEKIIDDLLKIYPNALGVRSHSLNSSSQLSNLFRKEGENAYYPLKNFLSKNLVSTDIVISNDSNLIKFLLPDYRSLKVDLTRKYNNEEDFLLYHPDSFSVISVNGLINFINDYKVSIILLNKSLYSDEEIITLKQKVSLVKVAEKDEYEIHRIS